MRVFVAGASGIADRVEIEALRSELTDAAMMRDYNRGSSLPLTGSTPQAAAAAG